MNFRRARMRALRFRRLIPAVGSQLANFSSPRYAVVLHRFVRPQNAACGVRDNSESDMHMVEAGKGLLAAAKTAADAQKAVTNATSAAKDASSKMAASAKSTAAALVAQVEIDYTVHLCLGCEGPSARVLARVVSDYPSFCLSQAELLLGGRQPVWLHPSFREEVLGQSLVHEAQPSAPDLTAILGSMTLVVAQLQSLRGAPPGGASPALAAAAAAVHESFRQSLVACQHMVPGGKPTEPQPTQALLAAVVARAKALTAGGALVAP